MLDRAATNAHSRAMIRLLSTMLVALPLLLPLPLRAQGGDATVAALWAQDLRLAGVAQRLLRANAPLCRQTMGLTGLILHSDDQYASPPPGWFANGAVTVAQVLPGSAADRAGITAGAGLLAINGQAVDSLALAAGYPRRDAAFDQLANAAVPVAVQMSQQGQVIELRLDAPLGCRALVELLADTGDVAHSDGRVIQLSYGMAARLDDAALAVVLAHELAHLVLEHNRRLGGASSRRLARMAEVEADRLSVHLLANAGYDPQIAPAFWQTEAGRSHSAGIFGSGRYPSRRERTRLMEQEIADYLTRQPLPSAAAHLLALRDFAFIDQARSR